MKKLHAEFTNDALSGGKPSENIFVYSAGFAFPLPFLPCLTPPNSLR
jgi:hypothetical protein